MILSTPHLLGRALPVLLAASTVVQGPALRGMDKGDGKATQPVPAGDPAQAFPFADPVGVGEDLGLCPAGIAFPGEDHFYLLDLYVQCPGTCRKHLDFHGVHHVPARLLRFQKTRKGWEWHEVSRELPRGARLLAAGPDGTLVTRGVNGTYHRLTVQRAGQGWRLAAAKALLGPTARRRLGLPQMPKGDAESFAVDAKGALLVGFQGHARAVRLGADDPVEWLAGGPGATPAAAPGIETLVAADAKGGILIVDGHTGAARFWAADGTLRTVVKADDWPGGAFRPRQAAAWGETWLVAGQRGTEAGDYLDLVALTPEPGGGWRKETIDLGIPPGLQQSLALSPGGQLMALDGEAGLVLHAARNPAKPAMAPESRRAAPPAVDLRDAPATGWRMSATWLAGARVDRARLWGSVLKGRAALDLAAAQPHPFFQPGRTGPADLRILRTRQANQLGHLPTHLVVGPAGQMLWLEDAEPVIHAFSRAGVLAATRLGKDTRAWALVQDAKGRLWCFGDQEITRFELAGHGGAELAPAAAEPAETGPVRATAAAADGSLWIATDDGLFRLEPGEADGPLRRRRIDLPWLARGPLRLAAQAGGSRILALDPAIGALAVLEPDGTSTDDTCWAPAKTSPTGALAYDAKNRLLAGLDDGILAADAATGEGQVWPLSAKGERQPLPAALAVTPDGAVWFTEPRLSRIGRVDTAGRLTWVQLPPCHYPAEIQWSPPLERVVATLEPAGFASLPLTFPAAETGGLPPRAKPPSGAQERSRADSLVRFLLRQSRAAIDQILECGQLPRKTPLELAPDGKPGTLERKGAEPPAGASSAFTLAPEAEAGTAAEARLYALTTPVNLPREVTRWILDHQRCVPGTRAWGFGSHGAGRYLDPEVLENALAEGLARVDAVGEQALIVDLRGRRQTCFQAPGRVGSFEVDGKACPTSGIAVVTERQQLTDREEDVVDAYPAPSGLGAPWGGPFRLAE